MQHNIEQSEDLTGALAEGIAAVMAANEQLEDAFGEEEMADLFLGELNRLWVESPMDQAA